MQSVAASSFASRKLLHILKDYLGRPIFRIREHVELIGPQGKYLCDINGVFICDLPYMSRIVRKPDFCLGENKGADQLRGNREADQRLCFRYSDRTIPLLLKSEISIS